MSESDILKLVSVLKVLQTVERIGVSPARNRERKANRKRNREFALEAMEHLTDKEFETMFRFSRPLFDRYLQLISPAIDVTVWVTRAAACV